jgi:hypothetical protein
MVTIERESDNKDFTITFLVLRRAAHGGTTLTCGWSMIAAGPGTANLSFWLACWQAW